VAARCGCGASEVTYSGFNIGRVDAPRPELAGVDDPRERGRALRALTTHEAEMVHGLGGNMTGAFYKVRFQLA
jgi:hypothetical protein